MKKLIVLAFLVLCLLPTASAHALSVDGQRNLIWGGENGALNQYKVFNQLRAEVASGVMPLSAYVQAAGVMGTKDITEWQYFIKMKTAPSLHYAQVPLAMAYRWLASLWAYDYTYRTTKVQTTFLASYRFNIKVALDTLPLPSGMPR